LIRDDALHRYRATSKTSGAFDYEAMLQAIEYFVQCAEESNQEGGDGDD
jgi:hypothetical protein